MDLITILTLAKERMEKSKSVYATIEESLNILDHIPDLKTKKSWVCSAEDFSDGAKEVCGEDSDIKDECARGVFAFTDDIDIANKYSDNYDEFTHEFCPCPNYLEILDMINKLESNKIA